MAYYTGRDVDVYISTEHDSHGIAEDVTNLDLEAWTGSSSDNIIAYPLADLGEALTKFTDVTGVDVSIGAQDEDVTYMGLRNVGKIEIKKDTSITITMKKKDRLWLQMYQGSTASAHSNASGGHPARWGLEEITITDYNIQDGTIDPKSCVDAGATGNTTYGYRLAIEFKASSTGTGTNGALLVIPNCTVSEVTHTTSNEAADEESVTFTSQVKPLVGDGARTGTGTTDPFEAWATTPTLLTKV
jgi:hypothetical protein